MCQCCLLPKYGYRLTSINLLQHNLFFSNLQQSVPDLFLYTNKSQIIHSFVKFKKVFPTLKCTKKLQGCSTGLPGQFCFSASRTQAAKRLCQCVNPLSCSPMLHRLYILTYITYALYRHKNLVNLQKSLCTLYTNIAIFCVRCAQVFSINKYYFTTL